MCLIFFKEMSKKRKNELDELLKDAVKFMEWPSTAGPTTARLELPDDFVLSEKDESETDPSTSSTSMIAEEKILRSEERKERKKTKNLEIYVPDKPLSPDEDRIVEPRELPIDGRALKVGNKEESGKEEIPSKSSTASRLNLLSLVQETKYENDKPVIISPTVPLEISVSVLGDQKLQNHPLALIPTLQHRRSETLQVPLQPTRRNEPEVTVKATEFRPSPAQSSVFKAHTAKDYPPVSQGPPRHPLLLLKMKPHHQPQQIRPQSFIMGAPSRR